MNHLRDKVKNHYQIRLPHFRRYVPYSQDIILKYQHIIHFNIDKEYSYLFLTRDKGRNISVYFRETGDVTVCHHRMDDALYKGDTLFIGYHIDKKFLIEDILIHNGTVLNTEIDTRIKTCNYIIDYQYVYDPILCQDQLLLIDYIGYQYLQSFWTDYRLKLPYCRYITGIVFVPLGQSLECCKVYLNPDSDIGLGNDVPDLKPSISFSDPNKKYGCFIVESTEKSDIYKLYLRDYKGNRVYIDIASVPDSQLSLKLYEMFRYQTITSCIMICEYDTRFKRWIPLKVSARTQPDSIDRLFKVNT